MAAGQYLHLHSNGKLLETFYFLKKLPATSINHVYYCTTTPQPQPNLNIIQYNHIYYQK